MKIPCRAWLGIALLVPILMGCHGGSQYIGIMVGDPTGLSYREEIGAGRTVAAGLGLGFADGDAAAGHLDWIQATPIVDAEPLEFYYGIGIRLRIRDDTRRGNDDRDDVDLGPRVPFGLNLPLTPTGTHIFFELAPGIDVIHVKLTVDVALGIRFPL